jgi:hypothetical protein
MLRSMTCCFRACPGSMIRLGSKFRGDPQCQQAGIRVTMVTGDHSQTALAIAREIGLIRSNTPTVITGTDLENMSTRRHAGWEFAAIDPFIKGRPLA